jgi:hypothetical protein
MWFNTGKSSICKPIVKLNEKPSDKEKIPKLPSASENPTNH